MLQVVWRRLIKAVYVRRVSVDRRPDKDTEPWAPSAMYVRQLAGIESVHEQRQEHVRCLARVDSRA
jgi:hypothetical protein